MCRPPRPALTSAEEGEGGGRGGGGKVGRVGNVGEGKVGLGVRSWLGLANQPPRGSGKSRGHTAQKGGRPGFPHILGSRVSGGFGRAPWPSCATVTLTRSSSRRAWRERRWPAEVAAARMAVGRGRTGLPLLGRRGNPHSPGVTVTATTTCAAGEGARVQGCKGYRVVWLMQVSKSGFNIIKGMQHAGLPSDC